jgi:molecular chaperone Hsp33
MREDFVSRVICNELNIRAYTVISLNAVREIIGIHQTSPNATLALGRTINASALLSATLKPDSDQTITLKFSGNGPIREIQVQADARGNIRGYAANPVVDPVDAAEIVDFSEIIGEGFLSIIKDIGLREPYSSIIPLKSGDIARDVAYYLSYSEQIPSALILGLKLRGDGVLSSGGILVQTLPETSEDTIVNIEKNILSSENSLGDALAMGEDIYSYLSDILGNASLTVLQESPLRTACRCNRDLLRRILKGLGAEELRDMIDRDRGAEISCIFCREHYTFNEDELRDILLHMGN